MPTVPKYQRQVGTAPVPSARVDITAPGASFGVDPSQALSTVVQADAQARQRQQDHADQIATDAAELQAATAQTNWLTKATSAQGVNAMQSARDAQEGYRQDVAAILEAIPEDRVRERVASRAANYYNSLYANTESHASAQMKKAGEATANALISSDIQLADSDPSKADEVVARVKARVADFGNGQAGWSPEKIAQQQATHVSEVHSTVIDRLLRRSDFEDAGKYYDAHQSELIGRDRDQAEALVANGRAQFGGMRQAQDIIAKHTTEVDALAAADAIPDDAQRDVATKAVQRHFTQQATAQHRDRQGALARLLPTVESSGGQLNTADPDWLLIQGHPEGKQLLHRQNQLLKPAPDRGDPDAFNVALNMAAVNPSTRAEFLQMDFVGKDGESMNAAQRRHLIELQRQYRGQDARQSKAHSKPPIHVDLTAANPFDQFRDGPAVVQRHATQTETVHAATNPAYRQYLTQMGVIVP